MAVFINEPEKPGTLFNQNTSAQLLALFSYQTGAMLEAGLPLLSSLELSRQQAPVFFQNVIRKVEQDLREGNTLAGALRKHPEVFPSLMVSMVEAGELAGILPQVFSWLAAHYEKEDRLQQKVKSALAYPMLVLLLSLFSLLIMFTFILPGFGEMLSNMGVQLPLPTRMVLGMSSYLVNWGLYLAGFAVILGIGLHWFFREPVGGFWRDLLLLKTPFLGELTVKILAARFCRILGALLDNGVPILQAMGVVKKTLGNKVLESSLTIAEISLTEGKTLARPLSEERIFPPLMIQLVSSGEETGQLPQFLGKLSDYYDREVERTLERGTALLEPILIVLLGLFVGGIVLAMLLPLFNMLDAV